ncbi:MAG: hypothetical protein ABFC96_01195 [Thermoguttaceae bacterium]
MRFGRTMTAEEIQAVGRFEGLRNVLLSPGYAEHLDKPLCYWMLPTDRRLPLAFLGRTLRELLSVPFAELAATPGIGRKKVASLVQLLARAANTDAADLPSVILDPPPPAETLDGDDHAERLDVANISEVTWAQWRASVVRHGLADEALGRLAPSLQNMTRVVWNTPLSAYCGSTLAEMRAMKTHGEKRIAAILEVFQATHAIIAQMGSQDHLAVRILPRRIDAVERWIGHALQRPDLPCPADLSANFVEPLLDQVRTDASQQVAALAENRLGVAGPITSVRQAARMMGLTRARVYQLLNEINDIMMVRWPTGRHQTHELRERFRNEAPGSEGNGDGDGGLQQFDAAVELFYPGSRRGAAGPVERAFEPAEQEGELLEVS